MTTKEARERFKVCNATMTKWAKANGVAREVGAGACPRMYGRKRIAGFSRRGPAGADAKSKRGKTKNIS